MRDDLWIIECRSPNGSLDFTGAQPEAVFGAGAITGMTSDAMAKTIFRAHPDAVLTGDSIALWPHVIDSRFTARRKTWSVQ